MAIQVVSFHCVLKNKLGRVISSTFNQNVMTDGPRDAETLTALVEALQDLEKGEKRKISLSAEQAYGFYNPKLVITCPLEDLSSGAPVKLGERVIYVKNGIRTSYRVIGVSSDIVTLDANHPLAGQDLVFEIEATEARDATLEELGDLEVDTSSGLH